MKLSGSMTALATPFRNGALDEEAYRGLVRQQLAGGTAALLPMGTTGEAMTMSPAERIRAVRLVVEEARGKVPVIAGAGSNSTAETVEAMAGVREAGADGALVVTPYYNKPNQAGLLEHYRTCARAHPGFPIVVYNVPGRTAADILPDTLSRLCELPEIVAVKEATGNMARAVELREKCGTRLVLLSGDDFTVAPFIACGGEGVVSVSSNVAPRMMADLVDAARQGDRARAVELQTAMNPLHRLLFIEPNPIPVKWALHLLGTFGPEIRLPLVPLGEPHRTALAAELRKLGLLG
jgi:4-hydroxy-tetrahydrodipicolinate synthase